MPARAIKLAPVASTSIVPLVDEWHATLTARRFSDRDRYRARVLAIVNGCGWAGLEDATSRSFGAWFSSWSIGKAVSTSSNHISSLTTFLGWCKKQGLLEENWARAVDRPVGDKGEGSRAMTPLELARLVAVAAHGERTDPRQARSCRSAWYIVAAYTGLRTKELRHLTVGMIDWREAGALLVLDRIGKGRVRKRVTVPLHPTAESVLRMLCTGKPPDARVFPSAPFHDTFTKDLERAEIPLIDHRGRKLSPHGLRKTFATSMARYGVGQRAAQALMRHTDPRMTANIYQDSDLLDLFSEVSKLPKLQDLARCESGGQSPLGTDFPKNGLTPTGESPILPLSQLVHMLATPTNPIDRSPAATKAGMATVTSSLTARGWASTIVSVPPEGLPLR